MAGLVMPSHAEAADGYTLTSTREYRFDPSEPSVMVESTYVMTNTSPDSTLGDGRTQSYFYDSVRVPLEQGAADVTVDVDGQAAQYEQVDDIDGFKWLDVRFNSNLRFGNVATIVVRYELKGAAPRTVGSFIRVNPAYVSFPVLAYGDDGGADVSVVIPDDWVPEYVGDDLHVRSESGSKVYEAVDIESPLAFFTMFTARQDDFLASQPINVGDSSFELHAWPGDDGWREFAAHQVADGVPVLEQLTGTPWPDAHETEVIETLTPYLYGYGGYYYTGSHLIEIGEDLDSHTMLHELSHAWFNETTLVQRWLSEGLADEISARAVARLGEPMPTPDDIEVVGAVDRATFHLNSWTVPNDDDGTNPSEQYGYQQALRVLDELTDEIGQEKMTALVAAVLRGDRAYFDEDEATPNVGTIDWREFLDLAEQIGGSKNLIDSYRQDVVTPDQEDELDARASALVAYAALATRGGEWAAPESVRIEMSRWRFDKAAEQIDDANTALDARDALERALLPLDLTPIAELEMHYEHPDELSDVAAELKQYTEAADRIVAAQHELSDRLNSIHQLVPKITQNGYEAHPLTLAGDREQLADEASELVDVTTKLESTLARFDLTVPALPTNAFIASPEGAIDTVEGYQRAADAVVSAHARQAEQPSFVERMGEIGSTADTLLAEADTRLAAGDVGGAIAAANSAHRAYDKWQDRGLDRLQLAGQFYAGVLLFVIVGLFTFAGSRQLDHDMEPATAGGQTWPDAVAGDAAHPADAGEVVPDDPDG